MDLPVLAATRDLLRSYEYIQEIQWLENVLIDSIAQADSPHDFAAAFFAIWSVCGRPSYGDSSLCSNPFVKRSMCLVEALQDKIIPALKIKPINMKVDRTSSKGLVTNYPSDSDKPADWVHHERRLWNEKMGVTYQGAFMNRKKTSKDNGMYSDVACQNVVFFAR